MEPRTLVLTIAAQPHQIIGWKKAVTLAFKARVDVLETYAAEVSAESVFSIEIPAVIKLRRHIKMHQEGVKFSRSNVLVRDNCMCCYCGKRFLPELLNYDHVVPRVQGGLTKWENVVTSCYPCNGKKGGRTAHQAGMKMHYVPYRPHVLSGIRPLMYNVKRAPEQWLPYLQAHALTA